ncbi:hypothetical protein FWK35_00022103, partial [Aphis craccivora]
SNFYEIYRKRENLQSLKIIFKPPLSVLRIFIKTFSLYEL